jgi:vacuolar-type H+-ATPase subunit H
MAEREMREMVEQGWEQREALIIEARKQQAKTIAELWEIYEALAESLLEEDIVELRSKAATQIKRLGKVLGFDKIKAD